MRLCGVVALCRGVLFGLFLGVATAASAQTSSAPCNIQFYPADRLRSVGEDFDAVHKLDQDLQDYERAAGKPLEWLTPDRQAALASEVEIAAIAALGEATLPPHGPPLTRMQALAPGMHKPASGCQYEVSIPQILLERGGLSSRCLRLFGVLRLYQDGQLVRSFSGYASAPTPGFRLASAQDVPAATALVESAYRDALAAIVRQSMPKLKK